MARTGAGAAAALLLCVGAAQAADIQVEAEHTDGRFVVRALAKIDVALETAWQVITDYGNLSLFIPDMIESRVLSREGNRAVVAQKGRARFLFFSRAIEVMLEVEEFPVERVVSRATSGDFREMDGAYTLQRNDAGLELRYEGHIVPNFFAPPFGATSAVRRLIEGQFRAMVEEILRRGGQPPEAAPVQ